MRDALSGNQSQSEAIRGHQLAHLMRDALSGNQLQSEAIRGHQLAHQGTHHLLHPSGHGRFSPRDECLNHL